jgi:hypothetical protein
MFARIISMVQAKFRKPSSQQEESPAEDIIEDIIENPIAEFLIQIDDKGDFAIGAECFSTEEEYATFLAMTLYLLNSGMLADYFVEALRLCSEGDEAKLEFIRGAMQSWKKIYDDQDIAVEGSTNKDAVDPKDVFSFHAMRP